MADTDKAVTRQNFATALISADTDQHRILAHANGAEVGTMLKVARAHDIPVVQDFALSSALRKMPAGTLIPDTVFQSVAVVLDFLLRHEPLMEELQNRQEPDNGEK